MVVSSSDFAEVLRLELLSQGARVAGLNAEQALLVLALHVKKSLAKALSSDEVAAWDTWDAWTAVVVVVDVDIVLRGGRNASERAIESVGRDSAALDVDLLRTRVNVLLVASLVEDLALERVPLVLGDIVVAQHVDFTPTFSFVSHVTIHGDVT